MLSRTLQVLALAVALTATAMAQSGKAPMRQADAPPASFTELAKTSPNVIDRIRAATTRSRYNPLITSKGPVTFYTDRTSCEASASALVSEDFDAAALPAPPNNVASTETPLSSFTSDATYAPGDIEAGLVMGASGATISLDGEVVVLGAGFAGIPSSSAGVGANFFADNTRMDFRPGATTVCFDYISFTGDGAPLDIAVYGTDGTLLGMQNTTSSASFAHSGVSSSTPIGHIVIFDAPSDGTFVDDVSFELSGPAPGDAPTEPELFSYMGSGTTAGGPTFARSAVDFATGGCIVSGSANDVNYDTFSFTPDGSGLHIVNASFPDHDGYITIYEGSFDPSDACANFVAQDDDGPTGTDSAQAFAFLTAGTEYIVVSSAFSNGATGSYTLDIFGGRTSDGGGGGGGGTTVEEDGDAPDALSGTQDASGAIDQITGLIEAGDIADCFSISIANIDAFSATTQNSPTNDAGQLLDSQIQIFTSGLDAVVFNDDTVGGSGNFLSTIPEGTLSGLGYDPGDYVICITEWDVDAQNAAGENIFAGNGREIRFPSAPSGDNVLAQWFPTNAVNGGRPYQLDMTGLGEVVVPTTPIADARAAGPGGEVTIAGVVTRAMGAFTYLQDGTAGITIRQTSGDFFDDVADGTIAPGTQLTVTGTTSQFRGLFQINGGDLASYSVDGTTDVPAPQMVSVDELNTNGESYEGELVQVSGLTTADMGTFSAGTNYTVNDGSGDGTLRVPNADDSMIDGTEIPGGPFTFTGVVGQFTFADPATDGYQMLAIADGDVEADLPVVSLPITFEEDINYDLVDFNGTTSTLVADPTDPSNTVVQTDRSDTADCFAGTVIANSLGFTEPIPFAPGETTMSVRVWSPVADTRILLKVEQVGNPGIFVETTASTTMAGEWETVVFDFANPMPNGQPIDFNAVYNKAVIFFAFSCDLDPVPAPVAQTYYWDDVAFGVPPMGGNLPLMFAGDTSDDPTFQRAFPTATACSPSSTGNGVKYEALTLTVDTNGSYAIQTEYATTGHDGYLFLYEGSFDPAGDPCANLLAWDDDFDAGNGSLQASRIEAVDLVAGTDYIVVVTGFSATSSTPDEGPYTGVVEGPPGASGTIESGVGGGTCEDLTIALSPVTDYTVPSEGGMVRMVMEIVNDTDEACSFAAWGFSMDPLLTNGVFIRPGRAVTVPANSTLRQGYNQRAPSDIADGEYMYSVNIGQYDTSSPIDSEVYDMAMVTITKGAPMLGYNEFAYGYIKQTHGANEADFKAAMEAALPFTPVLRSKDWGTVEHGEPQIRPNDGPILAEVPTVQYTEVIGTTVGPNPFRSSTTFGYDVEAEASVRLVVYDVLGRVVATPVEGRQQAGRHSAVLSGRGLQAGTYVYRLQVGDRVETGRVTLAR